MAGSPRSSVRGLRHLQSAWPARRPIISGSRASRRRAAARSGPTWPLARHRLMRGVGYPMLAHRSRNNKYRASSAIRPSSSWRQSRRGGATIASYRSIATVAGAARHDDRVSGRPEAIGSSMPSLTQPMRRGSSCGDNSADASEEISHGAYPREAWRQQALPPPRRARGEPADWSAVRHFTPAEASR